MPARVEEPHSALDGAVRVLLESLVQRARRAGGFWGRTGLFSAHWSWKLLLFWLRSDLAGQREVSCQLSRLTQISFLPSLASPAKHGRLCAEPGVPGASAPS